MRGTLALLLLTACAQAPVRPEGPHGADPDGASVAPELHEHEVEALSLHWVRWPHAYVTNSVPRDVLRIEPGGRAGLYRFLYEPSAESGYGAGRRFTGTLVDTGISLDLQSTELDAVGWPQGLGRVMIPVLWGERRYVVPKSEVLAFCNSINAGFEVGALPLSPFFVVDGDQDVEPSGLPNVTPSYLEYLLDEPIEGQVLAVERWAEAGERPVWLVTINAGERRGVRAGMEFHFADPVNGQESLRVLDVGRNHCDAIVWAPAGPPRTGWHVSTRSPFGALGAQTTP